MRFFFLGSTNDKSWTDGISSVLRLIHIGVMRLTFLAGRPSKTIVVPCSTGGKTVAGATTGGRGTETMGSGVVVVSIAASMGGATTGRSYTSPNSPDEKRTNVT